MKELLKELSAEFLNRASTRSALLTVTGIELSSDQKHATILLSIMPKEKEYAGVDFANRHRSELMEYIKKQSRLRFLPRIEFTGDVGEQNRQRISELLENTK